MSSIVVFISSKAFNSPPRPTSTLADPPRYLNREIKWWTDGGDTHPDFDDAAAGFAEAGGFGNASGWVRLRHVVGCVSHYADCQANI